jgi:hypothetical protein
VNESVPDHQPTLAAVPPIIDAGKPSARAVRGILLGLGGGLAVLLGVLFWFNPARHGFYPTCVFHRLTGLECPGCGGLRAVHHLLHGEILTAFRFNPLVVVVLPFLVLWGIRRWWCGPRVPPLSHRAQARWGWVAFGVLMVFWIVRNLPLAMFQLPPG